MAQPFRIGKLRVQSLYKIGSLYDSQNRVTIGDRLPHSSIISEIISSSSVEKTLDEALAALRGFCFLARLSF